MFDLTGKIALITGASRGLGYDIGNGFSKQGAIVILNGRNPKTLEKSANELCVHGYPAHISSFDVTDSSAIKSAVSNIETTIGPIDILVNNAGIQHRQLLSKL